MLQLQQLFFPPSQTRCKGQSTQACSHEQLYTGTCTREGEEKEGEEEKRGRGGMVDVKNRKCSCGKCVRFGTHVFDLSTFQLCARIFQLFKSGSVRPGPVDQLNLDQLEHNPIS